MAPHLLTSQEEREAVLKSRQRVEKLNETLTKELETELRKENQWDDEIQLLEKNNREKHQMLEDKIRKLQFTWERDQKNLIIDLEQIQQRLEDYENEVDEQWEKKEQAQEKELEDLNAELSRVRKGGEEEADMLVKKEAEVLPCFASHPLAFNIFLNLFVDILLRIRLLALNFSCVRFRKSDKLLLMKPK